MSGILPSRQRRPRRAPFMLTPLIDVMFLLLIFFMLSSQLSPYSLLPIGRVAGESREPTGADQASTTLSDLSVRVASGVVAVGGETVAMSDLAATLEKLIGDGVSGFVVIATRSANVQDVVTTLEALQRVGAERVTLMNATGGAS